MVVEACKISRFNLGYYRNGFWQYIVDRREKSEHILAPDLALAQAVPGCDIALRGFESSVIHAQVE